MPECRQSLTAYGQQLKLQCHQNSRHGLSSSHIRISHRELRAGLACRHPGWGWSRMESASGTANSSAINVLILAAGLYDPVAKQLFRLVLPIRQRVSHLDGSKHGGFSAGDSGAVYEFSGTHRPCAIGSASRSPATNALHLEKTPDKNYENLPIHHSLSPPGWQPEVHSRCRDAGTRNPSVLVSRIAMLIGLCCGHTVWRHVMPQ